MASLGPVKAARSAWEGWLAPATLGCAFAALAAWSWGKWADPVIDFGAELYVAWRLSLGDLLYHDIAYRHGPLSPHLNALWFRLFGPSITTLVIANLAILAAICALSYRMLRRACDRTTATVGGLVLLGLFGFCQYVGIGNYNYVTPYQHAQTHGLLLSLGLVAALGEVLRSHRVRWAGLAGACLGLVLLTKSEIQLPALAASAAAAVLVVRCGPVPRRGRLAATFLGAALVPPAIAFLLLWAWLPAEIAGDALLGNWRHLGDAAEDPFYRAGMGLDRPAQNLGRALVAFGRIAGFAAVAALVGRFVPTPGGKRAWSLVLGVAAFLGLATAVETATWLSLARALPLTTGLAALGLFALCLGRRGGSDALARFGTLALWAVWALALLGKMILNARVEQYGFVLAMPATLLLVAALVGEAPWLGLSGDRVRRALGLGAVAACLLFFLARSESFYARKTIRIGEAADAILVEPGRGTPLAAALETLEGMVAPGATLAVLPEGAGLNYWLRRASSSRYTLFLPAEFQAFGGESVMLADLIARPPDFVVLVDRPHREFGVGPFGVDPRNGRSIRDWVRAHYRRVERIGAEPFRGRGFGLVILQRARP